MSTRPANLSAAAAAPAPFSAVLTTPFGGFGICADEDVVEELVFLPPGTPEWAPTSALAERAANAVRAYLDDPDHVFDLPLARRGTAFQQRVWQRIAHIPRGMVEPYGTLAADLASAPRAVGGACGANPFPLVIPCHRVVSRHGPGGFAGASDGWLLQAKLWLLAHEAR